PSAVYLVSVAPSYMLTPKFSFHSAVAHRALHSFPTRRSSDLLRSAVDDHVGRLREIFEGTGRLDARLLELRGHVRVRGVQRISLDRKSTRLNSSHVSISYAVFCLKNKKRSGSSSHFCRRLLRE